MSGGLAITQDDQDQQTNKPQRDEKGRLLPGNTANHTGRPKEYQKVKDLAKQYTETAINTLAEIASDTNQPARARVSAADSILNRAWGKPAQTITGPDGESSPQLQINITTDQQTAQQIEQAREQREREQLTRDQDQGTLIDVTPDQEQRDQDQSAKQKKNQKQRPASQAANIWSSGAKNGTGGTGAKKKD